MFSSVTTVLSCHRQEVSCQTSCPLCPLNEYSTVSFVYVFNIHLFTSLRGHDEAYNNSSQWLMLVGLESRYICTYASHQYMYSPPIHLHLWWNNGRSLGNLLLCFICVVCSNIFLSSSSRLQTIPPFEAYWLMSRDLHFWQDPTCHGTPSQF